MSLLDTVRDAFEGRASRDTGQQSEGAYWCHDCSERILDLNVEGDAPPDCPDCGDEMAFERSPDSGDCAC
jgi:DNA-directed RNA polymerase subunit RPC12/RpoP